MKNLLLLFLLIPALSFAQKVKHDKDTDMISIDGKESFKVVRDGCGMGMPDCHFDVFDNSGKKVIRVNYRMFNSPMEVSKSNPNGTVRYYEFIFLESRQKCETRAAGIKEFRLAKFILKSELMVDGQLKKEAVDDFVFSQGTPFSDRVKF